MLKFRDAVNRYSYLFGKLVVRDFKLKYKRSTLGVLWSLLNPLFTMIVQYLVFSSLFRYDMKHYVVYLFTGIIFFSFMTDATTQAMTSVVSNANLITKVYVPKYIFPISKVISSSINFSISLILLLITMIVNQVQFSVSLFLLPFPIICLMVFSMGIGLILSALMVFFRDIQFLYGVIVTAWMYMTPIFYPESILPPEVLLIVKLNPLYHIIRYARVLIIDGGVPQIRATIICGLCSLFFLVLGIIFFKRTQNNFAVNL